MEKGPQVVLGPRFCVSQNGAGGVDIRGSSLTWLERGPWTRLEQRSGGLTDSVYHGFKE